MRPHHRGEDRGDLDCVIADHCEVIRLDPTHYASDDGGSLCRSGTTAMNPSTPITKANATPN
jgi:hypothetical protein